MTQIVRILHEYTKFAGAYGLIAGQVVDIESEGGKYIKSQVETLDFIHLNKTAVLFRLAVRIGAIAAGADDETINKFDDFAKNSDWLSRYMMTLWMKFHRLKN